MGLRLVLELSAHKVEEEGVIMDKVGATVGRVVVVGRILVPRAVVPDNNQTQVTVYSLDTGIMVVIQVAPRIIGLVVVVVAPVVLVLLILGLLQELVVWV
jgi:hypothetical protein